MVSTPRSLTSAGTGLLVSWLQEVSRYSTRGGSKEKYIIFASEMQAKQPIVAVILNCHPQCWPSTGWQCVTPVVHLRKSTLRLPPQCKQSSQLLLWNPEETLPEVQNRHQNKTCMCPAKNYLILVNCFPFKWKPTFLMLGYKQYYYCDSQWERERDIFPTAPQVNNLLLTATHALTNVYTAGVTLA